ncbi:hypothetical protein PR048_018983 [Dryococelus australis]|uniref:Uncharacterized protein n=1 Tax=Dryococelus australis TaxID=614101 RepID=A0ABQ9H2A4_9NEOP|nr:hypothetical protein PR048_018983 [Dryococelus australis]
MPARSYAGSGPMDGGKMTGLQRLNEGKMLGLQQLYGGKMPGLRQLDAGPVEAGWQQDAGPAMTGWRGKWEIPEKTRQPVTSSDTIPTCENPKATLLGVEPANSYGTSPEAVGHNDARSSGLAAIWTDVTRNKSSACESTSKAGDERVGGETRNP